MPQVSLDQVRGTYKARDSWWTVLLVDPIAARLVRLLADRVLVTPTRLTVVAFLLGLGAAAAFLQATPAWLIAGAALYFIGFTVDCVDGKIARIRGQGSVVGSWLDFLLDRVRAALCTVALFAGQYLSTGNDLFLFTAIGVVFLGLIGYLNGAETDQAKRRMAAAAEPAIGPGGHGAAGLPVAVLRLRDALQRHRIRLNLVSGVEFEMALFVIAPVLGAVVGPLAIIGTAAVAAGLLIAFEAALMARFVVSARAHDRMVARARLAAPATAADGVPVRPEAE